MKRIVSTGKNFFVDPTVRVGAKGWIGFVALKDILGLIETNNKVTAHLRVDFIHDILIGLFRVLLIRTQYFGGLECFVQIAQFIVRIHDNVGIIHKDNFVVVVIATHFYVKAAKQVQDFILELILDECRRLFDPSSAQGCILYHGYETKHYNLGKIGIDSTNCYQEQIDARIHHFDLWRDETITSQRRYSFKKHFWIAVCLYNSSCIVPGGTP
mmetsp:Transcript_22916/g.35037  ORF Transcript_22916/g.35037 Transcript_22916/m.35037 type:complete len:213 (-) Transcript_22916:370-1008(-)